MTDVYQRIIDKRLDGKRLNLEEGILLYSCDLLRLGRAAHTLVSDMRQDRRVTFIVDRNVSYTNACIVDCDFCAFYRRPGDKEAYTLSYEQIFDKIQELVDIGGTQVLIQGGVNPELPLDYYLNLLAAIRERFPEVDIHSFSVVEFDMISKKFRLPPPPVFPSF